MTCWWASWLGPHITELLANGYKSPNIYMLIGLVMDFNMINEIC